MQPVERWRNTGRDWVHFSVGVPLALNMERHGRRRKSPPQGEHHPRMGAQLSRERDGAQRTASSDRYGPRRREYPGSSRRLSLSLRFLKTAFADDCARIVLDDHGERIRSATPMVEHATQMCE